MIRQRMEAVVSFASGEVEAQGRERVTDSPCINAGSNSGMYMTIAALRNSEWQLSGSSAQKDHRQQ